MFSRIVILLIVYFSFLSLTYGSFILEGKIQSKQQYRCKISTYSYVRSLLLDVFEKITDINNTRGNIAPGTRYQVLL